MQKKRSLRIRRLLSFMLALMIALALTPVSSTLAYLPSDLYRMQVGVHADHILTIPPYVTPDDGEIYGWSVI
ncbi:MAG: hypothetical protein LBH09_08705, partial [Peptococcaceae bacterium]|nr:hypothetical protein [Peptococcaceae bacterium]